MLSDFRSTVATLLRTKASTYDVYEFVPSDVAAYPCLVVGRPGAEESAEAGSVFDLSLDVYVCGRAQSDDAQEELDKAADDVWLILGGTKTTTSGEYVLTVTNITPSVIALAGNTNIPAYVLTAESAMATC